MSAGQVIITAVALYVAAGFCVAVAFVSVGVSRAVPHAVSFTIPARLILIPGATALWPYVLARWIKARRDP